MSAEGHYDRVTRSWMEHVMGDELHFGLFATGKEPIEEAARALTDELARRADLAPGQEVLDVGCGAGTQALLLSEREGVWVTGISTSEVGIAIARARAPTVSRTRFEVRDATDTRFPAASFDRVLSLESAHLMDKERLFRECHRVLKPGGKLALCDVALVGDEGVEIAQYVMLGHTTAAAGEMRRAVHETMHRAFGSEVLTYGLRYEEAAAAAGFTDIETVDISDATRPTLARWAANAAANKKALVAALGERYVEDLFLALLHMSVGWGQLGGYILMTATKPQPDDEPR